MFKNMIAKRAALISTLALILLVTGSALASPPNLNVQQWQAPSVANVNTPYQYRFGVKNTGTQTATGVTLTVDLPVTTTSPQVYLLGKLTGVPTGCSVVSRKLQCNIGSLGYNQSRFYTFTYELPVANKVLSFTARATTTSTNEQNPGNNLRTITPVLGYPTNQLVSANVLASHCTGTNLSSYFECELFPSSITTHTMTLNAGGTISLNYPGWSGTWDQVTPEQLHFVITDGVDGAEFYGYAGSSTCFEGITTFIPTSSYMSPYKVCVQ